MILYQGLLLFSDLFNFQDSVNEHRRTELTCSVAENATLRKLFLHGPPDYLTAVLHGVAASASVEELKLFGKLQSMFNSYGGGFVTTFATYILPE